MRVNESTIEYYCLLTTTTTTTTTTTISCFVFVGTAFQIFPSIVVVNLLL